MSHQEDSLLTFPCEFPIKVMGEASLTFEALVLKIVRRHVPNLGEAAISSRYSKGNNYISLTITIVATSREQLDAIYQDLSSEDQVLMVL